MGEHQGTVQAILAVAAVLTALGVIWRTVGRPFLNLSRRLGEFLDDWNGQPARPGREAIKGIPERLATLETDVSELTDRLGHHMDESVTDRTDLRARLGQLVAGASPSAPTER